MTLLFYIVLALAIIFVVKLAVIKTVFKDEIRAALERDPAAKSSLQVMMLYSGFHALIFHRIARFLYRLGWVFVARWFSQLGRFLTGVEIHPGAQIGRGLFIDHGMGVVIGETTVIHDNVTIYQGVTLGGTGKEAGKRHPTLGNNVVVGAGAKILGDLNIGDNVFVGANAVVVRDAPAGSTVVGVPGRIASREGKKLPGINLDHSHLPDPLAKSLQKLQHEIDFIEDEIKKHHHDKKGSQ